MRQRFVPGTDQRTSVPGAAESVAFAVRAFVSAAKLGGGSVQSSALARKNAAVPKER
jgi:hypothetical protein